MINIKDFFNLNFKNEIISGVVVALVIIPNAIVFSVIAGITPIFAIFTAIILGTVTALLGGKNGTISGLTGAISIVLLSLSIKVEQQIIGNMNQLPSENEISMILVQYILFTTLFAGIFQVVFGAFKITKYIRLVPNYVAFGLVSGLAIMTITTQLYTFELESQVYYILIVATLIIIYLFPQITTILPSTFVALIVITFVVIYFDLDTKNIGSLLNIEAITPSFNIPKIYLTFDSFLIVLPYALLIALVSSLESLITVNILDDIQKNKEGNVNQESIALGAGNVICAFLGAPAGSVIFSETFLNFKNGAYSRISMIIVPVALIVAIFHFFEYISLIPVAVIIGILISIPISLFEWQNKHEMKTFSKYEKVVLVLVATVTIFVNLEIAFILSILFATCLYLYKLSIVTSRVYRVNATNPIKIYELYGPLYKYNLDSYFELFDIENDPNYVIVNFRKVKVIDQSAVDAIDKLITLYKDKNKDIKIKYLSNHCKNSLKVGQNYYEFNEDDPKYKVATDS